MQSRRCARSCLVKVEGRLRWRARRGTRELDALFGGWLDERFPTADEAQQQAFDELLDVQDPDLWDWVMGHARPERADWQAIIDDIRARHRL
jgi:antitoxin CptB